MLNDIFMLKNKNTQQNEKNLNVKYRCDNKNI